MPTVVLVGTLDTKGSEYDFVRALLAEAEIETVVVDCGILGPAAGHVDISRDEVAQAAGVSVDDLVARQDRGHAVQVMAKGAREIATRLHREGRLQGALALGGTGGTSLASEAFRVLPIGVPKMIVSTAASGDTTAIVGESDIMLCPSIVDVAGLNRISKQILANAAFAMAGMAKAASRDTATDAPLIGASMFGVTTAGVTSARMALEAAGFEVLTFHMTGTGGRTLESLVTSGMLAGVLDLTTTELADELVGGVFSAGADRLRGNGPTPVPRIVSVGALDMVNFGPRDTVPPAFADRNLYVHNATITLMRTTPQECAQLGRRLAERVASLSGPAVVMLPLEGVSALSIKGAPFFDPQADAALFEAIREHMPESVEVMELETDINDPAFAQVAVETLTGLIEATQSGNI